MGTGRMIVVYDDSNSHNLEGKLTAPVLIICLAVATAGLIFGYDIGISSGITTMESFLKSFFPSILEKMRSTKQDQLCIFNSLTLLTFSSSLYIAGIFSALLAGRLSTSAGRKGALIIGGMFYIIGASVQALSINLKFLILGRVLSGFGLGFTNQAGPIYLAEMAPTKWRGAIGTSFQIFVSLGAFTSIGVGIYTNQFNGNWRVAIGSSAFPATILTIIAFFIPDTPSSLVQRGKVQEALQSLNHIRSQEVDTESELKNLINHHIAIRKASEKPYRIFLERKYRPHLVMSIAIQSFQQFAGLRVVMQIGPMLYKSLGLNTKQILIIIFIFASSSILCTLVATYAIDRFGRKMLLIQGGVQIFICQPLKLVNAIVMASYGANSSNTSQLKKGSAFVVLLVNGFHTAAFSWSWAPLPWIVPIEILPIEVRAAGQALSIAFSFGFQFFLIQTTPRLLCNFKNWIFYYHAVWVLVMTLFVAMFLPETKRIPLESMDVIWQSHWYWHRFSEGTIRKSEAH